MTLLILGCALFLGTHFIGAWGYRPRVEAAAGHHGYMGLVTFGSIAGIVLIVFGYKQMEAQFLWLPFAPSYELAIFLMPIAAILLVAGNMPCNISRLVPHSMLTGIALWAALHLLANGDLASTIIFVTFGGYALYRRVSLTPKAQEPQPIYRDAIVVVIGLAVYWVMLRFHEALSGVALAV
jgi:uncharacterized membrane protein